MKVVFRADASLRIGTGHVVRCLTLARALDARGVGIRFVCRAHPGHCIDLVSAQGFEVTVLPESVREPEGSDLYDSWRAVSEDRDAAETGIALGPARPDWLILDHYGLGRDWETSIRPLVGRILVIDDLPGRDHDCDVILNQNLGVRLGQTPSAAKRLEGPRYALLRPEFAAARAIRDEQAPSRLLVYLGGVDADDVTSQALSVLTTPEFSAIDVDLIVGIQNPRAAALRWAAGLRPRTQVTQSLPHLAGRMARADLAIGAGGSTSWERLCLGLPTVVVATAQNQVPICAALSEHGLIEFVGEIAACSEITIAASLRRLLGDGARRTRIAELGPALVDGLGALRVAEVLAPTPPAQWRAQVSGKAVVTLEAQGLPLGQLVGTPDTDFMTLCWAKAEAEAESRLLESALRIWSRSRPVRLNGETLRLANAVRMLPLRREGVAFGGLTIALLTDRDTWFNRSASELVCGWLRDGHQVQWVHSPLELAGAELCFYLSCEQIVSAETLSQHAHNLVVHGSALPQGKGWSPVSWKDLAGETVLPMTLFEAAEAVDSCAIHDQAMVSLHGTELVDDLRSLQAEATLDLCRRFVADYPQSASRGRPQEGDATFSPRRRAEASRLDPNRSLGEQFDLLRIVDNDRYPAFFDWRGRRFLLAIFSDSD